MWLLEGTVSSIVADIIIAGVGVMVGFLRAKNIRWVSPLIYGLLASTLTALLIMSLNVEHNFVIEQRSMTTTDNIQQRVRNWLDDFKSEVQSEPDKAVFFRYVVTMSDNNRISISRLKNAGNYLLLQAILAPNSTELNLLHQLNTVQQQELTAQIRIEIARQNISRAQEGEKIYIEKRIPITAALSQNALIEGIDYMDSTMTIVQNTVTSALIRNNLVK